MKILFMFASVMVVLFIAGPNKVVAQKTKAVRIIEGKLSDYSCGDNCYLTITDKKGKKHIGLCNAPLCSKWNDEMPKSYKGKRVKATVGKGTRYDGSGNIVDNRYDAFIKIQLLK